MTPPDSPPLQTSDVLRRRLAEDIVFILVQPQHPGNVGAAARGMMNMGLRRLVVVDPAPSFDPERARWLAPGAGSVLDAMRIVPTLDDALDGVHRAIATTARHRRHNQKVHEPPQVALQFLDEDPGHVTAILFGREDMGLANEHTQRCESLLRISTDHHASLNLGQAVLLIAHDIFEAARARGMRADGRLLGGHNQPKPTRIVQRSGKRDGLADVQTVEPAVVELVALLNRVGYTRATDPDKLGVTLREAMQHARLSHKQVDAMRGMLRRLEFALDRPDIDWQASRRQQKARQAQASTEGE